MSKFSPQTDIYSLAATLYYLLSGETPQQAPQLVQEGLHFPASIPMQFRAAISRAMSSNPTQRHATVVAFLADLNLPQPKPDPVPNPNQDDHTVIDDPQPAPQPRPVPPRPAPSPRPEPKPKPIKPIIGIPEPPKKKISPQMIRWGGGGLIAVIAVVLLTVFWPKEEPTPAPIPVADGRLYYDESTSELVYGSNRYKMVYVDGGSFSMGATPEQVDPYDDEKPVHRVTLSSYRIGQTEVPQWLWVAVMGSNPSNWKGDNLPVELVFWADCHGFLSKLNAITGKSFRLPTEAEWEYAARGGNRSRGYQYSGSNNLDDVAWYEGNSGEQTHDVGTKRANELGLYDMSGNVYEWCHDWCETYPDYSVTNPKGAASGSSRVDRGGSWSSSPGLCRVAYRSNNAPDYRCSDLGFRLVL